MQFTAEQTKIIQDSSKKETAKQIFEVIEKILSKQIGYYMVDDKEFDELKKKWTS